jgi:hypothetical protein
LNVQTQSNRMRDRVNLGYETHIWMDRRHTQTKDSENWQKDKHNKGANNVFYFSVQTNKPKKTKDQKL